jgi:hypothetical protein
VAVEMICMFGQYTCQPGEHFDGGKLNLVTAYRRATIWTGAPCSHQRTWAEEDGATRISYHGAPPTTACAAFIKESRMKFANAIKLDRKSGAQPLPTLLPRGQKTDAGGVNSCDYGAKAFEKISLSTHVRWGEHGAPVHLGPETKFVRFLHNRPGTWGELGEPVGLPAAMALAQQLD